MGPALVTGNTIVVKPSSITPINCHIFAEIVHASGLPAGVFNVVNGPGAEIGNALASHPQVDMVSLTGSVDAGRQVMEAAATNITKVSLELGGKAPAIVLKDADLDLAVKSILASRVGNTGQICNCAERVYVHSSLKDAFIEKMTAAMKGVRYGNPAEAEPGALEMGPLIEERAVKSVAEKVERAVRQGATLVCGGKRADGKGYFFEPTPTDRYRQQYGHHEGRNLRPRPAGCHFRHARSSYHFGKRQRIRPDQFRLHHQSE